ncbi:GDSL-type esterase/lipase family protein [Thauera sinica]|uniref:GDSL-type esterase/lipase family protein n=1 Tax=Thauera sinica TaxID=2665146 RepID=A0ABW1AS85_9RHOO|nr:GDSL-type esterase/lipase family protein [Thauera sp. K11]ATE61521.1 arylesterase [Thauera sp. K11]
MDRRRFLASMLLTTLLAACGKRGGFAAVPRGALVLAFGDSVTYGTGAAQGEDWPSLLAGETGWEIVNAGVPGDTAQAGKARIQELLDEHRPALVIVEIGGNDFIRRRSRAEVAEDVRSIIRAVKQAGAQLVLVAVPELSLLGAVAGKPSDAPLYAELARAEGVPLVADVFSGVLGQPALRADRIHPNAAGYRRMASGILEALRELGLAQ